MAQTISNLKLYGFDAKLLLLNPSADLHQTALNFRENSPRASFFFIPDGLASCAGRLFLDINSSSFDSYATERNRAHLRGVGIRSKQCRFKLYCGKIGQFKIWISFFNPHLFFMPPLHY